MQNPASTAASLPGIHHVTAITGDVRGNVAFYEGLLGQRLVKVTVNYDDPTSYHLYYGDRLGTPGTLMTFFGWPGARGVRGGGAGQVGATAYAADAGSLTFWRERLDAAGVTVQGTERFGEAVLQFQDPDGMPLEIVATRESDPSKAWTGAADIPAEHALRGFHSVTLVETSRAATEAFLTQRLGFAAVGQDGDGRTRFRAAGGGAAASLVDVVERPDALRSGMGAGGVHHVAFRTPDDDAQRSWLDSICRLGVGVSPVMDRDYFHSIYFREPGGTLFEIATDGPGMTVNEPADSLGTRLMLPAAVEKHRAELERILPALR